MAKQTRYLVRPETREVFIWTETLAKRPDLVDVYAETPVMALERDAMPDPRRITLDQLENMNKTDLIIFAKVKLNLDLDASKKTQLLLDDVKMAIFMSPSLTKDETGASALSETRRMSSAADARRQAGA